MRLLLPPGAAAHDADAALDAFTAPGPPTGRPRVRVNMVASVDGATSADGESRGLSGPPDRRVFHRLRGRADAVVAGAATGRADRYGPARCDAATTAERAARGQAPAPVIVVVSASLELDWEADLFRAPVPTIVAHPRARRLPPAAPPGVRDLPAGDDRVDMAEMVTGLGRGGMTEILCEGGPGVVAQLAAARIIDEVFVAVSPQLVAGDARRMLDGPALVPPVALRLTAVLEADDFLFCRYAAPPG